MPTPPDIVWQRAVFSVPAEHLEPAARFWARVTEYRARTGDPEDPVTLVPDEGDPYLAFERAGDDGPARTCRLEFHVAAADAPTAVSHALDLGASGDGMAMRSPHGLAFSFVATTSAAIGRRSPPAGWARARRSIVDQLCIDIDPDAFDAECEFFAALTGWERRPGAFAEFDYLVRPTGMPLRLLLQRLDVPSHRTTDAHLDLACDAIDEEVDRHVAFGAVLVRSMPSWAVLCDPVTGIEYCVTGRDPDTGLSSLPARAPTGP